jgi:hypothetical protein
MRFEVSELVPPPFPVMALIVMLSLCAFCTTVSTALAAQPPEPKAAYWTLTTADDWRSGTLDGLTVVSDEEGDVMLTLARGRATGRFTSGIQPTPLPLTAVALFWKSDTIDGSGLGVELRLSQDQVTWSPWYPIYQPETQADGYTYGENIVAFNGAGYIQVRVTLSALTPTRFPGLDELTVVMIDASNAPTPSEALAASPPIGPFAVKRPIVISREAWGADPAYLDWYPEYAPVQRVVLHHTATAGGGNPVSEVLAIYYYHAVTRGWGDIGYNYLVDSNGNIYEGRHGGDDVVGAHTARWNTGALGVALLGCYDAGDCSPSQAPSDAALDAITDLVTWTASRRVLDPRQVAAFTNSYADPPLNLHRLSGHRDYSQYIDGQWYNATSCPGQALYDELPALRDDVWSRLPKDDARFEGHDTPTLLKAEQVVTVSLSLRNAGAATWIPGDVYVGYRWFDQAGILITEGTNAGSLATETPFGASLSVAATLTAPPSDGTYTLRWDLHRSGVGWFAEDSPASEPLDTVVRVTDTDPQRSFLPLISRETDSVEDCSELLVNGGAELDQAWEFIGGWPGAYSTAHVRGGDRAFRIGVESPEDDGYLYSSVQQIIGLPADAAQITLNFWYYPTSGKSDEDRAYVAVLDSSGNLLDTLWLTVSDAQTWQSADFDLGEYRGQTVMLRFTVINKSSPGVTAIWLDDISLAVCRS